MTPEQDLTGRTFVRWHVLSLVGEYKGTDSKWLCRCNCGVTRPVVARGLLYGGSKSCGCLKVDKATTHGMWTTITYKSWQAMRERCFNEKSTNYPNYGGRGIGVYSEWADSFEAFLRDMGKRPSKAYSIDRIDVNGDYTPANCRWATGKTQQRNRRCNHKIKTEWGVITMAEAAERAGIDVTLVKGRVKRKWPDEMLLIPMRGRTKLSYRTANNLI